MTASSIFYSITKCNVEKRNVIKMECRKTKCQKSLSEILDLFGCQNKESLEKRQTKTETENVTIFYYFFSRDLCLRILSWSRPPSQWRGWGWLEANLKKALSVFLFFCFFGFFFLFGYRDAENRRTYNRKIFFDFH